MRPCAMRPCAYSLTRSALNSSLNVACDCAAEVRPEPEKRHVPCAEWHVDGRLPAAEAIGTE